MKLLCINNKDIIVELPNETICCNASDLTEGQEYITRGKPFKDEDNQLCYYIDGIGNRLCIRFTELLEESNTAEKAIEQIKRELQLN